MKPALTRRLMFLESRGPTAFVASATAPDGSAVGEREAGWAAQPAADEFARLEPDREYLKSIASKTRGEVVDGESLPSFVASLSSRRRPITEPWTSPLWHQPLYFLVAIACLARRMGAEARQRPGMNRSDRRARLE